MSLSNLAKSDMFSSGAFQFTPQTKYLRNAMTVATASTVLAASYPFSASCEATIIVINVLAIMKVIMYDSHGYNSVA